MQDPSKGFLFDGRITEDFKLSSGTWVSVGPLRSRLIAACAPLVKDVVIAGHDRNEIGALVIPDIQVCRELLTEGDRAKPGIDVSQSPLVRDAFRAFRNGLIEMARSSTGSSPRVARIIVLEQPPSIDANEITDKGSINQRAALANRSSLVDDLYAEHPSPRVLTNI